MSDVPEPDHSQYQDSSPRHDAITELLPDYALGVLDDRDLLRVEAHLPGCSQCQATFGHLLELAAVLVATAPPSPSVKDAIFARAGLTVPAAPVPVVAPPRRPEAIPARRGWWSRLQLSPLPTALAGLALVAALLLGGWNLVLQRQLGEDDIATSLLTDPTFAYPLTDTELATTATGIFYRDPASDQALLAAYDLPPLPPDQRYQVWLFTADDERVSAGLFTPDEDGTARTLVDAPAPFSSYVAVGLSAEPTAGSPAPTTPLTLGGWIQ